eukprot:11192791-Lingulodinium_polyedra.AAC.1
MQPCSHATMQPCKHATMQSCNHATRQPCYGHVGSSQQALGSSPLAPAQAAITLGGLQFEALSAVARWEVAGAGGGL